MFVDDREPARVINQVKELIKDVELKRLDTGDYVIGDFAIERKTIPDLMGSVFDSRYWKQLENLKNTYPHPCVLIEGECVVGLARSNKEVYTEGDVSLVNSVCNATVMGWSVPIVYTKNYVDTAKKIAEFYARSTKKHDAPRAMVKKEAEPDKVRLGMLQIIEGVGGMGASRILSKYKFRDLTDIDDPSVLMKGCVGLSRKVAERVVKVFNHD
jgi:DNA excision repair protein ERCC-4